ncbi:MAG: 50S ribosomal protein L29 [Alphaproteobacteria bacterium]|nr:50S ribosomal protein L29 [Alphaproteobacteria bacterium]
MVGKKKKETTTNTELETAKLEAMRIRFRKVLGETVPAHTIRQVRKNIAKCVISDKMRGKNA